MDIRRYLPSKIKNIAKVLLNQANKPADLRKVTDNPIEAIYLAKNKPFVVEVEIEKCRSFFYSGYTYSKKNPNPAVKFLLDYKINNNKEYKESALEDYSSTWQPKTAAEVLGLSDKGASKIHSLPKTQFVYPWEGIKPDIREKRLKKIEFKYDNSVGETYKAEKGHKLYGPFDPDHMKVEIHRLLSVYNSIAENGYQRKESNDGDIKCHILINEKGDYALFVNVGTHRIAALSALGYDKVPVRITQAIYRSDVKHWPKVKSGYFALDEALQVFDKIFIGK